MTDPPNTYPREYRGRGRPEWRGRRCRIVGTWRKQAPHNVVIQFEDGEISVCPIRCTREEQDMTTSAQIGDYMTRERVRWYACLNRLDIDVTRGAATVTFTFHHDDIKLIRALLDIADPPAPKEN